MRRRRRVFDQGLPFEKSQSHSGGVRKKLVERKQQSVLLKDKRGKLCEARQAHSGFPSLSRSPEVVGLNLHSPNLHVRRVGDERGKGESHCNGVFFFHSR